MPIHKSGHPARLRCAAFLGACALTLLTACGGGGGGSAAPAPPPPVATIPEGLWSGTATQQGQAAQPLYGLVLGDGTLGFLDPGGNFLVTGTLNQGVAALKTYDVPSGSAPTDATLKILAVTPMVSFSGTATDASTGVSLNFPTYYSGYDSPLAVADMVGTFTSAATANSAGLPLTMELKDDLTLSGADDANVVAFKGTFAIPDPGKRGVTLNITFTKGPAAGTTLTGLGVYLQMDPAPALPKLILIATGPTKAFSGTFM